MMNNLIAKIQKNPFLSVLIVIVIGIAIFALVSLSAAISDSAQTASTTNVTASDTTSASVDVDTGNENTISIQGMKYYSEYIKSVEAVNEANQITFYVEFETKEALLEAHYATTYSFDVVPMLCFYIDNGLQVKLPGEFRLLSDSVTAVYTFSNIKDYVNAYFLTDNVVTGISTLLNDNRFNLYVEHFSNDGVGKTIAGNYAQTVEQFNLEHAATPLDITVLSTGIKKVVTTVSDEFIWVDIYYVDEAAYLADNADINQNFVEFGFEKGGNLYDRQFIINEYENLYMNRCVFDRTAMNELAADMYVEDISVKQFFNEYGISVWSVVDTEEKPLFVINGGCYAFTDMNDVTSDIEEQ